MVNLPKDICCGCGGCFEICPIDAIDMKPDENGFVYPVVDKEKCIDCGACDKVCQYIYPIKLNAPKRVLAAKSKSEEELLTSASGGMATIIAVKVIEEGGVVYGCAFDNANDIKHIRCTTKDELNHIKGSKYVQSDLKDTYKNVQIDLKSGATVLFIGLPCQVGGLRAFLKKDYANLYAVDLICHGVPSKKHLQNYLETCVGIARSDFKGIKVDFRWKAPQKGRIIFGTRIYNNGKETGYYPWPKSEYMSAFFDGFTYRWNCHKCKYSTTERCSDLTLGDFWGLGTAIDTRLDVSKGVSMFLINTEKGEKLFEKTRGIVQEEAHTIEEAKQHNKNLNSPTPEPYNKYRFLETCREKGMKRAVKEWSPTFKRDNSYRRRIYLSIASRALTILKSVGIKK